MAQTHCSARKAQNYPSRIDLSMHSLQNRWRHSMTVRVFRMIPTSRRTTHFLHLLWPYKLRQKQKFHLPDVLRVPRQIGHCISLRMSDRHTLIYLRQQINSLCKLSILHPQISIGRCIRATIVTIICDHLIHLSSPLAMDAPWTAAELQDSWQYHVLQVRH